LQASGKITSLAKVQIVAALAGLLLGLPAIHCWGVLGVALSILLAAAVPAVVLWRRGPLGLSRRGCRDSAGNRSAPAR
jgi:O-antigen/teichoic acid export membrane protein